MTLPTTCPTALRELRAWLVWRFEPNPGGGKPRKVPYFAAGGRRAGQQGSPDDVSQMVVFDRAVAAARDRGMDGVGFAVRPDLGVVALDFDSALDNRGNVLPGYIAVVDDRGAVQFPEVRALLASSYCEISPSGKGVRAFFLGQLGNLKDHAGVGKPFGFETFSTKGFVTYTGNVLPLCDIAGNENTVAALDAPVLELAQRRFARTPAEAQHADSGAEPIGLSPAQVMAALAVLDPDMGHNDWLRVGMALHAELGDAGFDYWNDWSSYSTVAENYPGPEALRTRWDTFGRSGGEIVTARSLVHMANDNGAGINLHAAASAEDFDVISEEVEQGVEPKAVRFQPVAADVFMQRQPPQWVVKGVLPRAELAVLFGESQSGKSFMALDLAVCIGLGKPWRGRRVRQGRVVYIAAEGAGGFRNRLVAYSQVHQLERIPMDIIDAAPNFLLKEDALDVARGIGKADLVIVDTWAQTMPGGDENSGQDVGKALSHCKGIHRATGATVLLVHHSGKDASKGARGWSGLRAAADAELEVVRHAAGRVLRTTKQKDGDDGLEWGFGLEVVTIGEDEDGDAITSCVVVEQDVPQAVLVKALGAVETVVNEVIQEFALVQNAGIEVTAVITASVAKLPPPEDGKRDTRKQRVRRAIGVLCAIPDGPYYLRDDVTIDIV